MPEQLGLDERRRHGRAVYRHEGSITPVAGRVNHACGQLFSGSTLSGKEHGGRAGGDGVDLIAQMHNGRRPTFNHFADLARSQLGARHG